MNKSCQKLNAFLQIPASLKQLNICEERKFRFKPRVSEEQSFGYEVAKKEKEDNHGAQ